MMVSTARIFGILILIFFEQMIATAETIKPAPAGGGVSEPVDEVLVLGVKLPDQTLSTFLVDKTGIQNVGPGLAVPRKDGWWRIDRFSIEQGESSLIAHVATPQGKPIIPPKFEVDTGCQGAFSDELLFVGADLLSLEDSSNGMCEGAAHPWAHVGIETVNIDLGSSNQWKAIPIDVVLGKEALAALKKNGLKAHGGEAKQEEDCLRFAGPEAWALIRSHGQWIVRGQLDYLGEVCRGNHEYFTVDTTLPKPMTGQTDLIRSWKDLKKSIPKLTDVVASPSKTLEVLVTSEAIEVLAHGASVGKIDVKGAAIVMTQWALGSNAKKWRSVVPSIFHGK